MACIENKEERERENLGFCGKRKNKKVRGRQSDTLMKNMAKDLSDPCVTTQNNNNNNK